jgi:hypothetical protein
MELALLGNLLAGDAQSDELTLSSNVLLWSVAVRNHFRDSRRNRGREKVREFSFTRVSISSEVRSSPKHFEKDANAPRNFYDLDD